MGEELICPECENTLYTTSYYEDERKTWVKYIICLTKDCKFKRIEVRLTPDC